MSPNTEENPDQQPKQTINDLFRWVNGSIGACRLNYWRSLASLTITFLVWLPPRSRVFIPWLIHRWKMYLLASGGGEGRSLSRMLLLTIGVETLPRLLTADVQETSQRVKSRCSCWRMVEGWWLLGGWAYRGLVKVWWIMTISWIHVCFTINFFLFDFLVLSLWSFLCFEVIRVLSWHSTFSS